MFAEVMPVQQRLGNPCTTLPQGGRVVGHAGDRFQDGRVVGRFVRRFSPAKRGMARHQNGRNRMRIETLETAANREAGVVDVVPVNFIRGQLFGYRNRAVEVIRVGGSVGGNLHALPGPTP